ncbi:unnamed protein product, partial [Leptidea sinapis]
MHTELRAHRLGGGVIAYIHNILSFTRHTIPTCYFECIIGEIETSYKTRLVLCAVYRPPKLNKPLFIQEIKRIVELHPSEKSYILIGDMNINLCDHNPIRNQYLDSMSEVGLDCGITQYTRVENKGDLLTKSCIDHIFLRATSHQEVHTAVINNAIADHYITELLKICKLDEKNKENRLLYNKYRNQTNKYIEKTRNNYFKNVILNNFTNQKRVWEIINNICGRVCKTIDDVISKHFNIATGAICNTFAYGFEDNLKNICSTCNTQLLHGGSYCQEPTASMRLKKATNDVIFKILHQLNKKKSPATDNIRWFRDYHSNRNTVVRINGQDSDQIPTLRGTAQGSILGPTEYLTYVNEMCNIFTRGSVYQFADDTCLVTHGRNIKEAQEIMQNNFDILCKWAHDMRLVINVSKTKLIHMRSPYSKSANPTIIAHTHTCLHGGPVPEPCACGPLQLLDQHTYLGLVIDENINWKPHIEYVCNKLRSLRSKIDILKHKVPYYTLRLLYLSLADSVISYGISSFGFGDLMILESSAEIQCLCMVLFV